MISLGFWLFVGVPYLGVLASVGVSASGCKFMGWERSANALAFMLLVALPGRFHTTVKI